jgi:hypothetical protein
VRVYVDDNQDKQMSPSEGVTALQRFLLDQTSKIHLRVVVASLLDIASHKQDGSWVFLYRCALR